MAIYHWKAEIISRSQDDRSRSIVLKAGYQAGDAVRDHRSGISRNYRIQPLYAKILAPPSVPEWVLDRAALWNAVEAAEKRRDAQLARRLEISLPVELTLAEQIELLEGYLQANFVDLGMVADAVIKPPPKKGDARNIYALVLLTLRSISGEGFGQKNRGWNDSKLIHRWRAEWASHANLALDKAGVDARIDHRSLKAQGIDRTTPDRIDKAQLDRLLDEKFFVSCQLSKRNRQRLAKFMKSNSFDQSKALDNILDLFFSKEQGSDNLGKIYERLDSIESSLQNLTGSVEPKKG